jgi:hypothetical protein
VDLDRVRSSKANTVFRADAEEGALGRYRAHRTVPGYVPQAREVRTFWLGISREGTTRQLGLCVVV